MDEAEEKTLEALRATSDIRLSLPKGSISVKMAWSYATEFPLTLRAVSLKVSSKKIRAPKNSYLKDWRKRFRSYGSVIYFKPLAVNRDTINRISQKPFKWDGE